MQTLLDIDEIKRIPLYSNVYHETIQAQHNQYYFYNKQHSFAWSCEQDKRIYQPLNEANLNLGRFFKKMVVDVSSKAEYCDTTVSYLQKIILDWQNLYNKGGTFDTFKYAEEIVQYLNKLEYPVKDEINMATDLLKSFMNIPYLTKSFFQISIIVPESEIIPFVRESLFRFSKEPSLSYYIKQLMIYHSLVYYHDRYNEKIYDCRIVKVSLLPNVVNSYKNPVINEIVSLILSVTKGYPDVNFVDSKYSVLIKSNVFVSQGNKNYKKFLSLLGIIDKVYSQESNYAYLN